MKFAKNNKTPIAIALVLVMTASIIIASTPTAKAAEIDTYMYQVVAPNPLGVGQTVQCTFMMVNNPPAQLPLESPRYGYWENLTLTILKPDGKTETINPVRSAEAGSGFTHYTPTIVGNYTLQWTFPGQTIQSGSRKGDYYKPCTSPKQTLVVQEEPIASWPGVPLPTEYWQAPLYQENRERNVLAGNWLWGQDYRPGYGGFSPVGTAPNSAHIMWTRQDMFGGILEAEFDVPYGAYTGRRPSEKLNPPIILAGRLYYNEPSFYTTAKGDTATLYTGFKCVDLYTGETIWTQSGNGLYITNGQIVYHYSTSQESIHAYLWNTAGSTWQMFDAWTGQRILNITNVASGTNMVGPHGEILRYQLSGANNWLTMWNSSKLLITGMRAIGVAIDWVPGPGVYNYTDGIQWNVTLTDVAGNPSINEIAPDLQLVIASNSFPATAASPYGIRQELAYSLKPGEEGRILWVQNRTGPDAALSIGLYGGGIYYKWRQETLQYYSYDAATGSYLGVTQPNDAGLSLYSSPSSNSVVAYGTHFNTGYDGTVRAWNKTGNLVWQWYAGSSGLETPEGTWPLHGSYTGPKAADGKVFVINSEHTPAANPWRGGKVYAINATTGLGIWNISGTQAEAAPMAIGFGYLVYLNGYDAMLTCFGKGPSATSVTASPKISVHGDRVMIEGSVTDISAGTTQAEQSARFPNGVPAVSESSQSAWMEYVYMQKPRPTNATGVPVTIDVLDSNGNYRNIGSITSDADGFYSFAWKPDIPGKYTVIAAFAGSESYWPSHAESSFAVDEAGPTASPYPEIVLPPTEMYIIGIGAAIIITIVIVGAAIVLLIRKRP